MTLVAIIVLAIVGAPELVMPFWYPRWLRGYWIAFHDPSRTYRITLASASSLSVGTLLAFQFYDPPSQFEVVRILSATELQVRTAWPRWWRVMRYFWSWLP